MNCLLSNTFEPILPVSPLLGPWPNIQAFCHCPWIHIYSKLGLVLFPHKVNDQVHNWKLCLLGVFPLTTGSKGKPPAALAPQQSIFSMDSHIELWTNQTSPLPSWSANQKFPRRLPHELKKRHWYNSGGWVHGNMVHLLKTFDHPLVLPVLDQKCSTSISQ